MAIIHNVRGGTVGLNEEERLMIARLVRSITKGWRRAMMRKQVRDFIHHQLIRVIQWRIT